MVSVGEEGVDSKGERRMLGHHKSRAHKLALHPENPECLYS